MWKARQFLSANDLWSMANVYVEEIDYDSDFFKANKPRTLSTFKLSELELGHELGKGGFCVINEINLRGLPQKGTPLDTDFVKVFHKETAEGEKAKVKTKPNETTPDDQTYTTSGMSGETRTSSSDNCRRYVVKRLRDDLSFGERARAVIDLSIEMKFLSAMSHRHIIQIKGMAEGDPIHEDFFLVMDRVYLTLEEKIHVWKRKVRRSAGIFGLGYCGSNRKEQDMIMIERAMVSYSLSSAFEYLHKKKIIYRDIKPENIGFDERGLVKVFDFGLCRELRPKDLASSSPSEKFYDITPLVGTFAYMAPEVLLRKPYNLLADVYSFGILLDYIFTLKRPFRHLDQYKLTEVVALGGKRPKLPSNLHDSLKHLIERCWSSQPLDRPEFSFITPELLELLDSLQSCYAPSPW